MCEGAALRSCNVVNCEEPATGSFLVPRDGQMLTFAVCPEHFSRLRSGSPAELVKAAPGRHALAIG